ncbi:hypothetical protein D9M69_704950 [compost metagenome]
MIIIPTSELIELELSFSAVAATYLLIATKCFYSLLSAAMGARGSAKEIWISNIVSVILLSVIFAAYSKIFKIESIESILWLFTLLWISRSASYSIILAKIKDD